MFPPNHSIHIKSFDSMHFDSTSFQLHLWNLTIDTTPLKPHYRHPTIETTPQPPYHWNPTTDTPPLKPHHRHSITDTPPLISHNWHPTADTLSLTPHPWAPQLTPPHSSIDLPPHPIQCSTFPAIFHPLKYYLPCLLLARDWSLGRNSSGTCRQQLAALLFIYTVYIYAYVMLIYNYLSLNC